MILFDLMLVILAQIVACPSPDAVADPLATIQGVSAAEDAPALLPPACEDVEGVLRARGSQG